MLVDQWMGVVHVDPAIPATWEDQSLWVRAWCDKDDVCQAMNGHDWPSEKVRHQNSKLAIQQFPLHSRKPYNTREIALNLN